MTDAARMKEIKSHMDKARWEAAESCCRKWLADAAENPEALKRLGIALYFQHKWPAAAEPLKQCVAQCPDDAEALHWLLAACRESYDTAGMYEAACKLRHHPFMPDDELMVYQAFENACAWHDAGAVQKRVLALARQGKLSVEQYPYLMVLLNHVPGISPAVIYDIHRVWGDSIMRRTGGARLAEKAPPPPPAERMKIAYLSADFREHPIGKFMRTIFASHDHHRFEVYCYVHTLGEDGITDEIRLASDHFVDITELDDEALARRIHADGIHVLVEIGSHMAHSRLAALAWKPAPVQITYLAEPNTTALPTVDFRITDANSEADGGTRYVEKQLYMPESFLCMGDLPEFERITTTPAEQNDYVTFCSFNGVRKFNPGVIAAWCRILKRVKGSRLVIKSPGSSVQIVRKNLLKEFKRHGITEERLEFVEYCNWQEHADWHNKVDIALDSFPYNGTTTTFDTLWMGVPVVTLAGPLHAQRTSYSILKNIGFDEAAAAFSEKEYVDKAVHLAEHPETLSFLRRCLPAMIRHSILFQPERFTGQLEQLYVRAWQEKMGAWQRTAPADAEQVIFVDHDDAGQHAKKTLKRIFITGMPRSGMAWIYRVVTAINSNSPQSSALRPASSALRPASIASGDQGAEDAGRETQQFRLQFLHAPTGEAIKAVQSGNAIVIYARRDLRDVAVALMELYGISFDTVVAGNRLPALIEDDETWEKIPMSHAARYENIVDAPVRVIKYLGECLGYGLADGEAESIAASCRQAPPPADDLPKPGESVPSGAQTGQADQAAAISANAEFDNDPPGIHRSRLSLVQAGQLNLALRGWLEKHFYVQPLYPAAGESKAINVNMPGDIRMCLPACLAQRSAYVLLEQEDWFEPGIRFLRQWLTSGMRCVDIGAGFGCFALTMARITGPESRVWALEPSDAMADFLHRSIELNGMHHCRLMRLAASAKCGDAHVCFEDDGETSILSDAPGGKVQLAITVTIDEIAARHDWRGVDFIRINAGGGAGDVAAGGEHFLRENSPLLMIAKAAKNASALRTLAELGYAPYVLIPGLCMLAPFDGGVQEAPHYLFLCKKDRARSLHQSGLLIHPGVLKQALQAPKEDALRGLLERCPYAKKFESIWSAADHAQMPGSKEYGNVLNMYVAAWGGKTPAQKRLSLLRTAFSELSGLVDAYANLPRLLTLARVAADLGETESVRRTLDGVIEHLQAGGKFVPEEPFLAASAWAEALHPGEHPAEWCLAQAIHARLKYGEPSSWHTQAEDISLLEAFRQCGFPDAEMERRRQLVLMRCGLQAAPESHDLLTHEATNNLNPDFWRGEPNLTPNPFWEFARSLSKLPCLCSLPKSGNTMTRIILEHYFQRPVPSVYAGDASILFNSGREHAVAVKCHYMSDVRPGSRLIYIHRDPRDVLISLFKWNHKKLCTEAPAEFEDFIWEHGAAWRHNLEQALAHAGPKLIVRYGDLVEKPREYYAKILSFLDDEAIDPERLDAALAAASKDAVAQFLTSGGATSSQQLMPVEKKTSRWRALMTPAQIGLVQQIIGASLLETLGYSVAEIGVQTDDDMAPSGAAPGAPRTQRPDQQSQQPGETLTEQGNIASPGGDLRRHAPAGDREGRQEIGLARQDTDDPGMLVCKLPQDVSVAVPNNVNLLTPYVLQEQQDWFEDEIRFIRRFVQEGMHIIDIGANYGCYALTMARLIGEKGSLWAFEPASVTAGFLGKSLELNAFHNVQLLQCALSDHAGEAQLLLEVNPELNALLTGDASDRHTETVSLKRLDDCMHQFGWQDIDFVKLDAEGEEVRILDGGRDFLEQCSPLIMFEIKDGDGNINDELTHRFTGFGYNIYILVPGLSLLAPFDPRNEQRDPSDLLNLFCCKDDRAERLEQAGLLAREMGNAGLVLPEGGHWQDCLKDFPYARKLLAIWNLHLADMPGGRAYRDALHAYALAHGATSAAKRLYYLQHACLGMEAALDKKTTLPRLFSLARVKAEFGRRIEAVTILDDIAAHFEKNLPFIPNEPFLAVSTCAERMDPEDRLDQWGFAQVLTERERQQTYSSYLSGDTSLPVLDLIRQLGFGNEATRRRLQLIRKRFSHEGGKDGAASEPRNPPELAGVTVGNAPEGSLPGTYATRTALICDQLSPELWRLIQEHCENVKRGETASWLILAMPNVDIQAEINSYIHHHFLLPHGGGGQAMRLCAAVQNSNDTDAFMNILTRSCKHVRRVEPGRNTSLEVIAERYDFLRLCPPLDDYKITICVTTYNRRRLLQRTVNSILAQTYPHFELVIMDDASSDGTEEYCRQLASGDGRIRYHRNMENIGMLANGKRCRDMINTELFTLCADDEFLYPEHFEHAIDCFRRHPALGMVLGQWHIGDLNGKIDRKVGTHTTSCIFDPRQMMLDCVYGNMFLWSGSIIRSSAVEHAASYAKKHLGMSRKEDIFDISDYFFSLLMFTCVPAGYVPIPAAFYPVHDDTFSANKFGGSWAFELRLHAVRYLRKFYLHRFGNDIYLDKRMQDMMQTFRQEINRIVQDSASAGKNADREKIDEITGLIDALESAP